jgi:hypothetical protein
MNADEVCKWCRISVYLNIQNGISINSSQFQINCTGVMNHFMTQMLLSLCHSHEVIPSECGPRHMCKKI